MKMHRAAISPEKLKPLLEQAERIEAELQSLKSGLAKLLQTGSPAAPDEGEVAVPATKHSAQPVRPDLGR